MEWIKVKAEHITAEYTDAQVGSLIRFQLLVARLKRFPTDKELYNETPRRAVVQLDLVLKSLGVDRHFIAGKVLEDVNSVHRSISSNQKSSAVYRLKHKKSDDHRDASRDSHRDGPREEEKREDKKDKNKKINKKNFLQNVSLTEDEHKSLQKKHGDEFTDRCIEKLQWHKSANGKSYKSDYAAINQWVIKAIKKEDLEEEKDRQRNKTTEERRDDDARETKRESDERFEELCAELTSGM